MRHQEKARRQISAANAFVKITCKRGIALSTMSYDFPFLYGKTAILDHQISEIPLPRIVKL